MSVQEACRGLQETRTRRAGVLEMTGVSRLGLLSLVSIPRALVQTSGQ